MDIAEHDSSIKSRWVLFKKFFQLLFIEKINLQAMTVIITMTTILTISREYKYKVSSY